MVSVMELDPPRSLIWSGRDSLNLDRSLLQSIVRIYSETTCSNGQAMDNPDMHYRET